MEKQLRYIGATIVLVVIALIFYIAIINYGNSYVSTGATVPIYTSEEMTEGVFIRFQIRTHCEDKIICYYEGGGMDCFRDEDLVEKYCGDD